jgi:tRNA (Thr-GGU) A37 N-methylase
MKTPFFTIEPIGFVRSSLTRLEDAPMQGDEGAPDAWLDISQQATPGLMGIMPGDELFILTWLHAAERDVLQVHPRGDFSRPLTGFSRPVRLTGQTQLACIVSPSWKWLRQN